MYIEVFEYSQQFLVNIGLDLNDLLIIKDFNQGNFFRDKIKTADNIFYKVNYEFVAKAYPIMRLSPEDIKNRYKKMVQIGLLVNINEDFYNFNYEISHLLRVGG